MTEREFATDVVDRLQRAGHQALWAGGCVRDELLGFTPADYDVATDARPERVKELFRRCHSFGASFGVVEVLGPRGSDGEWLKVQVATFRSDGTYSDGRHPDTVTFSSPEEDAQRRDFTINGMFYDPVTKQVIDYVGGQADLQLRVLRAIGNAAERFTEDKLRILRAVRMAARFELTFDPATMESAKQMAGEIRVVSAERIAEELRKILTNRHRARGFHLLGEMHLLQAILPELEHATESIQARLEVLAGPTWPTPQPITFELAFAVILHDVNSRETSAIAKRLRLSNQEADRLVWLIDKCRSLQDSPTLRMSQLQPILVHPGIGELLALCRADALATGRSLAGIDFCEALLRNTPPDQLNPTPLITGDDLQAVGMKPGPQFKRILDAVRDAQLNGEITTKADGLNLASQLRPPAGS